MISDQGQALERDNVFGNSVAKDKMVVREPGETRHRVIIEEPLEFQAQAGDRDEEFRLNMQTIVDRFSRWVARHPDHYLQFMLMRRRVRGTDVEPFFTDYPRVQGGLSSDEAEARLRAAGERT